MCPFNFPSICFNHDFLGSFFVQNKFLQEKVQQALLRHPAHLDRDICSRRLAGIGGDGAVIRGGEAARHATTDAGKHLWEKLRGEQELPFLEWDGLHRENIARRRSFAAHPATQELFDVAAAMSQLFGVGAGRIVLRSAADQVGATILTVPSLSTTRSAVALSGTPAQLIRNFKGYHAAMRSRLELSREGFGSQSIGKLLAIGRRLTSVDFCVFMLGFQDVHSNLLFARGQILQSQVVDVLELHESVNTSFGKLKFALDQVRDMRRLCTVLMLCKCSCLTASDPCFGSLPDVFEFVPGILRELIPTTGLEYCHLKHRSITVV